MNQTDPRGKQNVDAYNANVDNLQTPPDLLQLKVAKTAIDGQIANTPSTHPTYAALLLRQSTLATAISNHPKGKS